MVSVFDVGPVKYIFDRCCQYCRSTTISRTVKVPGRSGIHPMDWGQFKSTDEGMPHLSSKSPLLPSQFIQVYLPALEGHVPDNVIRTFCAFFEFCYIVRRNIITDDTLVELQDALSRFHWYCEVFRDIGVCPDGFALPRQHSLTHYKSLIRLFGAPNGLCTSITKSRHIMAVKKPWWCSNKHNALGLILQTNQRLSQLAAARADFEAQGMLPVSHPSQSTPQG